MDAICLNKVMSAPALKCAESPVMTIPLTAVVLAGLLNRLANLGQQLECNGIERWRVETKNPHTFDDFGINHPSQSTSVSLSEPSA